MLAWILNTQIMQSGEKKAAALKYDPSKDKAPRVLARAQGNLALAIEKEARKHAVPIVVDSDLSQVLQALPVGKEIPENLYRVVAGLLSMVLKIKQDKSN